MYDVPGYTDMLPFFGGDSGYTDAFVSARSTGVLTWRNSDFFGLVEGLNLAAQYPGKNERSSDIVAYGALTAAVLPTKRKMSKPWRSISC